MLSTCLTIPINNKGCLPYGSSSTISINTVNNTCRIRKSCFGYCNDIHLVGSSQFLEDTTIQELKTYSQKLTHMGVSFWAYTNLHCYLRVAHPCDCAKGIEKLNVEGLGPAIHQLRSTCCMFGHSSDNQPS
ncbi:hypothetical protein T09_4614 [Trichinella sp. T9]|nr:hypothetical protein T09_4614 [Trichinella sp. T9]